MMYGIDVAKEIVIALINNNRIETTETACEAFNKIVKVIDQANRSN